MNGIENQGEQNLRFQGVEGAKNLIGLYQSGTPEEQFRALKGLLKVSNDLYDITSPGDNHMSGNSPYFDLGQIKDMIVLQKFRNRSIKDVALLEALTAWHIYERRDGEYRFAGKFGAWTAITEQIYLRDLTFPSGEPVSQSDIYHNVGNVTRAADRFATRFHQIRSLNDSHEQVESQYPVFGYVYSWIRSHPEYSTETDAELILRIQRLRRTQLKGSKGEDSERDLGVVSERKLEPRTPLLVSELLYWAYALDENGELGEKEKDLLDNLITELEGENPVLKSSNMKQIFESLTSKLAVCRSNFPAFKRYVEGSEYAGHVNLLLSLSEDLLEDEADEFLKLDRSVRT